MSFILRGNICGYLCADCREPLVGSIIRFYQVENLQINSTINPKNTLQVLDKKSVAAKAKLLIGEAEIAENGDYKVVLKEDYDAYEKPIMVDILSSSVPHQKSNKKDSVQFSLAIIQPEWQESGNDLIFRWTYCITARFWCYIRSLFDAWVICGKIVSCEDEKSPVAGVKVTAFDADWIDDDELGSSVTDAQGHFRIDYTSQDFKQTFLSPIINVETPFPPYNSGPDVYFKIEAAGGQMIYEETRPDGQKRGRSNIGNCFCVDLCVDVSPTPTRPPASAWTGIGTNFTIPIGVDLNDFDTAGYAGSLKYGFTRNIRLTGQAAISTLNGYAVGNSIEYRFLVSDTVTGVNGGADVPAANFTKIVGVTTGLFVRTKIGQMWFFKTGFPLKVVDIYAEQADLDAEGWLDVKKSVLRTFTDRADLNPADLSDPAWNWVDTDGLMAINTAELTVNNDMPTVSNSGDIVPVSQRKDIEKIAIRFEIREVINKATNTFNLLPGSGQTLNAMVVNNTPALIRFDIVQLLSNHCGTLSGNVDVAYTVHHPHLEDVNLHLRSNSNTINTNLTDSDLPLSNNTDDSNSFNQLNNSSLSITGTPNNVNLITCAYIMTLRVKRRLHTGDNHVSAANPQIAFYYEA